MGRKRETVSQQQYELLHYLPQIWEDPLDDLAVNLKISKAIARDSKWQLIRRIDGFSEILDIRSILRILCFKIHDDSLHNSTLIHSW